MKQKIAAVICIMLLVCELVGCGKAAPSADGSTPPIIEDSYYDAICDMDNEYFKTKVLTYDDDGGFIIENEVTGEKFVAITGTYGITLTPIKEKENGN